MAEREEFENFDVRLVDYNLRCGRLSKKDYEQHLRKLPNSEEHADYLNAFMEPHKAVPRLTFTADES